MGKRTMENGNMTHTTVQTTKRYCPTCKKETEFYKFENLCTECFMMSVPGSVFKNEKKKIGEQGELFPLK